MRVEKLPGRMEYWHALDEGLEQPILVGVEHDEGKVQGVMIRNFNTGFLCTLKGAEVEALVNVLIDGHFSFKIDENLTPIT